MTVYDLIIDGSNLLLYGMTDRNKKTFVANLAEFREKLKYFSKRGRRALFCIDKITIDKIKKGKIKINESIENFEKIIEDTRFHICTPLKPGEIAVFDNGRILHSRKEFEGARHMEGTYLEWGSLYGAWRTLQAQASNKSDVYCGITVGKGVAYE